MNPQRVTLHVKSSSSKKKRLKPELQIRNKDSQKELSANPYQRWRPPLELFKHQVALYRKQNPHVGSCHAHEATARYHGFKTYNSYLASLKEET